MPVQVVARPVIASRRPRVRVVSGILYVAAARARIQVEGHES